jgi:peptidoglycan/LPS O-acetylase OafA/YrhL
MKPSKSLNKAHSKYRPDIDGLRTIAVVPVVLFHAGFSSFSGGYIGVDVFFVISGYLITGIIAGELDDGNFSIAAFYDRRVRRIFPPLLTVIVFCLAVGFWLLTPNDFMNLGKSILSTIFFVSNIYFWRNTNYFAQNADEQPLLHTWSLSIEEQFYLGYPLLLLLLSRSPRVRIHFLSLLCVASFVTSAVLVYYKPSATFYLAPTRAWELFFGGIICLTGSHNYLRRNLLTIAACLGVVLILTPVFVYTPFSRFPGLAALPPALGAGLLIWTGMGKPTFVHAWLSTTPFTAIGKASYSLYLWHFPLIVFYIYATGARLSPLGAAGICLTALAVSFASLWFVERPFRFTHGHNLGYFSAAVTGGVLIAIAGASIVALEGLPWRMDPVSATYLEAEGDRNKYHTECLSLEEHIVSPDRACRLGKMGVEPTVLLWGDSHAMVTATALEQAALRADRSFLFAASVDCPIGLGFSIDPHTGPGFVASPGYQYCGKYNEAMLNLVLAKPNIDTIVLSSRWSNWRIGEPGAPSEAGVDIRLRTSEGKAETADDNKKIFSRGFEDLVRLLTRAGKHVWIVGPVPEPWSRVPRMLYIHHLGFDKLEHLEISSSAFEEKNRWITALFARIGTKYPVRFIHPEAVLCKADSCPISENGKPMFFDDNHLSIYGVTKTAVLYDQIFDSTRNHR